MSQITGSAKLNGHSDRCINGCPRARDPCSSAVDSLRLDSCRFALTEHHRGPSSDAATAIRIAESALIKTYRKQRMTMKGRSRRNSTGIWSVYGTRCCQDGNGHPTCKEGRCLGGVAVLKLRKSDGKILSVTHTSSH